MAVPHCAKLSFTDLHPCDSEYLPKVIAVFPFFPLKLAGKETEALQRQLVVNLTYFRSPSIKSCSHKNKVSHLLLNHASSPLHFQWCRRNATWIQTSPISLPLKQQQFPSKLTVKIRFCLIPKKHWFPLERVRSFLQGMVRAWILAQITHSWLFHSSLPCLTWCNQFTPGYEFGTTSAKDKCPKGV